MASEETATLPSSQSVSSDLNSIEEEAPEAKSAPPNKSRKIHDDSDEDDGYIDMSSSSVRQTYQPSISMPTTPPCSDTYSHLAHPLQVSTGPQTVPELVGRIQELQERAKLLEIIVSRYHRENSVLQTQLKRYTQRKSGDVLDSKNLIYEFGANEVQALLDRMGLSMYVVAFTIEKIDGPLFLELDEEVLEHELGVKSALHRRRLMRVILGEDHINDVMKAKFLGRRATSLV